jgi:hypothetical protein
MFFVKLLPYIVVRNGSFSRRNAWYKEALEVADTSQGYVLYVQRAAWTPDAAHCNNELL